MQITLLGPVEAASDDGPVALGGPKPRALLAMLALDAGSPVPAERLIDGLWGDDPPATAAKMVQLYVSQLRKAMAAHGEPDAIGTRGRAYQLQLGRERVDAARFERLLAQGAAREALDLWRGPALADVADEPFAAPEIRRLQELRASALEVAIDQDLDAGRHRELLPELEALLAQEPLRERLHAQRMLALYRSGRQAEALEAYRHARATLVEQVGVEPGPELRRLHEAILRQDPALEPPGQEPPGSPLVGRDAELARLRELWRGARAGHGRGVLVTGPPGIGKTRLVQELAAEVRRDGGAVIHGALGEVQGPTLHVVEGARRAPAVPPGAPVLAVATAVEGEGEGETLELGPLGREDVAALARYHAGTRVETEPPVDRLLAESGGVPALVHRAAAAWAQAVATRRVGAAAARASAERAGWQEAGDDVAAEVVELQSVRERAEPADPDAPPACPFKGLASFDVDDAAVFFGRERLVADMIARLPGARLMGIVGPSGSGKSSVMRAGLLAALADGVLPGSRHWPQALLRPGAHPLAALRSAVAELPDLGRSIIAVDQFEETFTACADAAERAAFAEALVACARDPHRRALVLVAVRADFYGHCAEFPELSRLLGANHVLVGPMRRHELRRAIELPARRAGLRADPELVDALIDDVEHAPGALPLLSTTLLELWQQRDGRRLTLAAYESSGGVLGAVARLAEGAYERLDPPGRAAARRILLRLAGDGGVRVRVPIADLPADVHGVLSVLAADRLLTVGEGEVEVAHEALLREWPRLRAWLDEDADGRRVHRHLTEAAHGWEAGGRDPAELYRGSRLGAASDWAGAHDEHLNRLEREFLDASRAAAEAESERRRRANRRLRVLLAGVGTLLVLAVVAGAVALSQRGQARDAALTADAQRLGAEALTSERIDQALLLARAGVELEDSPSTRSSLLALHVRDPASLGELRGDGWPLYSVALSDDDALVAVGDERGTVIVYDAATRERVGKPYTAPEGLVQSLAFSPDGRTLALVAHCGTALCDGETFVDLIDPRGGERRRRFVLPPLPNRPFWEYATARFQPNGRDLIVQKNDVSFPDGPPSRLYRLDAARGTVVGSPLVVGRHGAWNLVTTADRARAFVTSPGDDATYEVDPETLRVVRRWPVGGRAGAVSADGRVFALGSDDGTVRVLDLQTGDVRRLRGRLGDAGVRLTLSDDGRTVVAADESGEIVVWDVERGAIRERFAGPAGDVNGLAISGDGRTLYSIAPDARMRIWDLAGDRRLDTRFDAGPPLVLDDQSPKGFATSPDGRTLAITQADGTVDLVDSGTLRRRSTLRAQRKPALGVDFSPDGKRLAVTGDGARVTLWDAATLAPKGELEGLRGFSQEVVFSPDGRLVAAGGGREGEQRVLVWDARSRRPTGVEFGVYGASLAFSPNSRLLAANGMEDPVEVRDVRTGKVVARLDTGDAVRTVAFSPDRRLLAVGRYGGSVLFYSTRTWQRVGRALDGHDARVTALEFSRDGRTLATGAVDGTVRLWSVGTQRAIGAALMVETEAYVSAGFSRDGSHLFAVPHHGRGVRWDVRPSSWKRHACVVAGRAITEREWRDALPDRAYRPVCG